MGLGQPCSHCTATGTEPFSSPALPCSKGCDDGFVKFIGYCPVIPFKRGDKVRIPKGTLVKTCTKGVRITGRTYTITVDHVLHGAEYDGTVHNPVVVWPGTGGYWSEADINDVEKVQ